MSSSRRKPLQRTPCGWQSAIIHCRLPQKRFLRLACRLESSVVSCRPPRRILRRGFPATARALLGNPLRGILLAGRQETTVDFSRHASRRGRFSGILCEGFVLDDDKTPSWIIANTPAARSPLRRIPPGGQRGTRSAHLVGSAMRSVEFQRPSMRGSPEVGRVATPQYAGKP